MTYTALTYSFPNLEPVCCSMSSSNCCFLTCKQISQEAGQVVWYSHLLKNFPQFVVIHTVKGFGIVNKAEVHVFLELSCFFDDPAVVGKLISGSSAFSKSSLNIWKFLVDVLLKPGLENFEHYFASVWDEHSCAVVWTCFGTAFPWGWTEDCASTDSLGGGRPWGCLSPSCLGCQSRAQSLSRVQLFVAPWTAARQAPLSKEFSRQEHWSGLPFPSPMHESEKWKGSL